MNSTLPLFKDSLFEPKCIAEARMEWDPRHLDLLIAYYKKKCNKEEDVIQAIEIYLNYCKDVFGDKVDISMADVFKKVIEVEPWSKKTCEVCKMMGLCKDPLECPIMGKAIERVLTDIDTDSIFYNPIGGVIEFILNNVPVHINLRKLLRYVVKYDNTGNVEDDYVEGNPKILNELYIDIYADVPCNPFTEDDVFKLYDFLMKHAVRIEPISERQIIRDKFLDMLKDGTYNFYDYNLLKSGEVTTWGGVFLQDNKYLYIKSSNLEESIEGYNIKKILEALGLFIVQRSKQIRVKTNNDSRIYRFTVFDFEAIKKYIKKYEHIDFEPKVFDKDELYETMDDVERFLRHQDVDSTNIGVKREDNKEDTTMNKEENCDDTDSAVDEDRAEELYDKILDYLKENGNSVKEYELEEWTKEEGYSKNELQHALKELMDDAEIYISKDTVNIL